MANKILWALGGLFLITIGWSYGQTENKWAFGINAGLDFSSGTPVSISTNMVAGEACASVCGANGQLLFYTNGEKIWDPSNNFMQNGFSIMPPATVSSTTQGALIVPIPDSNSKYFVFSLMSIENGTSWGRLYYSVVDMNLNNGLGAVEAGRKQILVDTGLQENMTAVAGKNCNIWLLAISQQGVLKAYNIDRNGVNTVPVQTPILPGSGTLDYPLPGCMAVSPDRKKLAIADSMLTLYDFNAATGTAANPVILSGESFHYTLSFSPDNSKLYAVRFGATALRQYDLSSGIPATIQNSMVNLSPGTGLPTALKIGPDGKIYCARNGMPMGVIHQPNLAGTACQYAPWSLPLTNGSAQMGLPNVVRFVMPTGDTIFHSAHIDVADCFTDTYTLQIDTPGINLRWDNGSTLPQRTVSAPGTYWATYSRNCIVYSDSFQVRFPNAIPLITVYNGCKGQHNGLAVAYSGNTGYVYTWRNASSVIVSTTDSLEHASAGTYTLHVVTPMGCDSTFTVYISEEEHQVSFHADSTICQGTTVSFVNTSDSHFTTFDWKLGDGNSSTLQNPLHAYQNKGYYTARLIGTGALCVDTAYQAITVDSLLQAHYTTLPDSICTGQSITFYPAVDTTVLALRWSYGDGTEMEGPNESIVQHSYDVAGTLPVQLTTTYRACLASTFNDTVYVYALPKVYLGPDSGLCLDGAPVLLVNQLPAPDGTYSNLWNTGDTTVGLKVVHPGTYSLTIRSGPLGCAATESVVVHKDCYVDIPNAFTPNGDGSNDYFFPRQLLSRKVTRFNMQIFNRWGQLIFETTSTDGRGWDGRLNGQPQSQGVYIYRISLTIDNHRDEKYDGNITLIR